MIPESYAFQNLPVKIWKPVKANLSHIKKCRGNGSILNRTPIRQSQNYYIISCPKIRNFVFLEMPVII
jgi:hypothetical protein